VCFFFPFPNWRSCSTEFFHFFPSLSPPHRCYFSFVECLFFPRPSSSLPELLGVICPEKCDLIVLLPCLCFRESPFHFFARSLSSETSRFSKMHTRPPQRCNSPFFPFTTVLYLSLIRCFLFSFDLPPVLVGLKVESSCPLRPRFQEAFSFFFPPLVLVVSRSLDMCLV